MVDAENRPGHRQTPYAQPWRRHLFDGLRSNYAVARGLLPGVTCASRPSAWRLLLRGRPLLVFSLTGALFHLANASMLSLVAQKLALQNIGWGITLTAACAIAAQSVMVPTAALAGARADAWGRRPLLLAAFLALALRGALYTVWDVRTGRPAKGPAPGRPGYRTRPGFLIGVFFSLMARL